ncbi:MAG: hypothetical protein VXA40_01190 [Gammaproteobacteria bacterium]|jgi:hypothetical protein
MISDDITFDKLLQDIDTQLEVLSAIAADNPILSEQLRVLNEAREQLLYQDMEINRLFELIDPDDFQEPLTIKQEPS